MAGFILDASEVVKLKKEMEDNLAAIMPDIRSATVAAGRRIQATARAAAPKGPHLTKSGKTTGGLAPSIYTTTRQTVAGVEVSVETKHVLGTIITWGTSTSGPHPFMKTGLDAHADAWVEQIADIAARIL